MTDFTPLFNQFSDFVIPALAVAFIVLILLENLWKKFNLSFFLRFLRIFLIAFGILSLIVFLSELSKTETTLTRLQGGYAVMYLVMILSNTLLPMLLFIQKMGLNKFAIFAILVLMNTGRIMEFVVITLTSFHREFSTGIDFSSVGLVVIKGLIIAVFFVTLDLLKQKISAHEK